MIPRVAPAAVLAQLAGCCHTVFACSRVPLMPPAVGSTPGYRDLKGSTWCCKITEEAALLQSATAAAACRAHGAGVVGTRVCAGGAPCFRQLMWGFDPAIAVTRASRI